MSAARIKTRTRLGKEIRRLLDMKAVSQTELADFLGYSRMAVSSIIRGRTMLTVPTAFWIAKYLDVPPDRLLRLALLDYSGRA